MSKKKKSTFLRSLISVVVAVFLLGYVGYQLYLLLYTSIQTETVYVHSVYETLEAEGIALRSETLLQQEQDTDGYVYYTVDNGDRVAKSGEIAKVYPTKSDALAEQEWERLSSEIDLLKSIQSSGTTAWGNMDAVNGQISTAIDALVDQQNSPSYQGLGSIKSDLTAALNKKQIITGKVADFNDRIDQLTLQRDALADSFSSSTDVVTSPMAGYFISTVDGYETQFSTDMATDMTTADIAEALQTKAGSTSGYVGKVVASYEWYFVCTIPDTYISTIYEGATVKIKFPFVLDEVYDADVLSCKRDKEGNMAVALRCGNMNKELSSIRMETIQFLLVQHTGLRVPRDAIVTQVVDGNYQTGVYVRSGNVVSFRRIRQEYAESSSYVICEVVSESGYLKLYDDIVVKGAGLYDGKPIR